jgi:hypothetical protein
MANRIIECKSEKTASGRQWCVTHDLPMWKLVCQAAAEFDPAPVRRVANKIRDQWGGFIEVYEDGSRYRQSSLGTQAEAHFIPARAKTGWQFWKRHKHKLVVANANGKSVYQRCVATERVNGRDEPCGYREATQQPGGYAPLDFGWVRTGEWTPIPPAPTTVSASSAVPPPPTPQSVQVILREGSTPPPPSPREFR